MAHAIDRVVLRLVLVFRDPNSLNRKQSILRTAVAFLADAGLLAPQVAVNGVTLGHFVVAIALGEIHAAAVGELAQQAQYLPLKVSGRPLLRIAEEDLVLDFQTAQLRVENIQFLVGGHKCLQAQCSNAQGCRTRYLWVTKGHGTKVRAVGFWLLAFGSWLNLT